MNKRKCMIDCCRGHQKADKVLKNANIINVFSKEIIKADIAIYEDTIVGIGSYRGNEEFDLKGKYVVPGFVDAHLHIESSMVSPCEFAKTVLPFGTTTLIADPHEIANVCGLEGIHYMLEESKDAPLDIYYMLPSCVPSTDKETSGARLDATKLSTLIDDERILGLGEMMNFPAVMSGDEGVLAKLAMIKNKKIDGHAPGLLGYDLMAYALAGVHTDHECSTFEEVLERIRLGMTVQIRKGSAADNLESIVTGLVKHGSGFEHCVFCTDDKHLDHILSEGHINSNIRESIALGVDPIEAICMATIYPAKLYNLSHKGAIAPGYQADLVILDDLKKVQVSSVMFKGEWQIKDGETLIKEGRAYRRYGTHTTISNTVKAPYITEKDLSIPIKTPQAIVIGLIDKQILTQKLTEEVPTLGGVFKANTTYSKIAVLERYTGHKNIGLGILKNFNISKGAIAQTIAHDSHNIICVGDNDKDMTLAINTLIQKQGGIVVVKEGKIGGILPLPIAGLMSTLSATQVTKELNTLIQMAYGLGINSQIDPFLTLAFMALPVIPEIKMTDKGIFDVGQFKHISIEVPSK